MIAAALTLVHHHEVVKQVLVGTRVVMSLERHRGVLVGTHVECPVAIKRAQQRLPHLARTWGSGAKLVVKEPVQ